MHEDAAVAAEFDLLKEPADRTADRKAGRA
jgi:hypothetical protein